ncbi:hypothetical protein U14_03758 [Candidatus Moduliflexus flocculans]|uniref:Uncharacterized protein n=1 Tax=Candidatus Moduliflexus flocculans TaxID=1499966 RepID=A0A081BQ41_9BACT|nr:hypothetical protein U14_03758 [Candidatus Moduliflexus flocculans]
MKLPFTLEEFLQVFSTYNQTVWPMQIVFNLLALFAIFFAVKTYRRADALISGILALLWLWICWGIAIHNFRPLAFPVRQRFLRLACCSGQNRHFPATCVSSRRSGW